MNARLQMRVLRAEPKPVVPVAHKPVTLAPIRWGQRDRALARAVCTHLVEATPPTVIPANPFTHVRMRAWLRTHSITHE